MLGLLLVVGVLVSDSAVLGNCPMGADIKQCFPKSNINMSGNKTIGCNCAFWYNGICFDGDGKRTSPNKEGC